MCCGGGSLDHCFSECCAFGGFSFGVGVGMLAAAETKPGLVRVAGNGIGPERPNGEVDGGVLEDEEAAAFGREFSSVLFPGS